MPRSRLGVASHQPAGRVPSAPADGEARRVCCRSYAAPPPPPRHSRASGNPGEVGSARPSISGTIAHLRTHPRKSEAAKTRSGSQNAYSSSASCAEGGPCRDHMTNAPRAVNTVATNSQPANLLIWLDAPGAPCNKVTGPGPDLQHGNRLAHTHEKACTSKQAGRQHLTQELLSERGHRLRPRPSHRIASAPEHRTQGCSDQHPPPKGASPRTLARFVL